MSGSSTAEGAASPEQFRGWLLKWTNYIKGYQRRWFVLNNGLLSYYRTQEEMAHTCRGTVNLAGAFIDTIDAANFVITNGPSQVYHLRAVNEVERQRWVTALELAKSKAIKNLESDGSDTESGEEGDDGVGGGGGGGGGGTVADNPLASLKEKLRELSTAHDLVVKNCHQVMKLIPTEVVEEGGGGGGGGRGNGGGSSKLKEKLTMFKITANAMAKAADEYMVQARNTDRRWARALQHEHSLRLQLQENIVTLANEMYGLESQARRSVQGGVAVPYTIQVSHENSTTSLDLPDGHVTSPEHHVTSPEHQVAVSHDRPVGKRKTQAAQVKKVRLPEEEELPDNGLIESDDDDEKFFDAPEALPQDHHHHNPSSVQPAVSSKPFKQGHSRNESINEAQTHKSPPETEQQFPVTSDRKMSLPVGAVESFFDNPKPSLVVRRTTIPPKPHHKVNLWNIMKNCIGKDLSKIPMPVNFNEPLSLLQRMVEEIKYGYILEAGARCDTTLEELAHVVVFGTSAYAHTTVRIGKPFNPLLGETYECDRRAELGWRCLLEQVSHHPPMFAMHVEHKDWTFWQEYTVASKFRGKYLSCYPIGNTHLVYHRTKSHYTWTKAVTTIHNIIVGKLWVDQSGELRIVNHTCGEEATVKYHAYSYFSREQQRKVTGTANDANGAPRYTVRGYWDQKMDMAKIITGEGKNVVTEQPVNLWTEVPPCPGSDTMYYFSELTSSLNEMEEGVAPTDSRLRPDQRIMEEGDFDLANKEKVRLEEKQRARRRKREAVASKAAAAAAAGDHEEAMELEKEATYTPRWFQKEYDPLTNTMMHVYKGGYWEAKRTGEWGELPDIF